MEKEITIKLFQDEFDFLRTQFGKREGEDDHLIPMSDAEFISDLLRDSIKTVKEERWFKQ